MLTRRMQTILQEYKSAPARPKLWRRVLDVVFILSIVGNIGYFGYERYVAAKNPHDKESISRFVVLAAYSRGIDPFLLISEIEAAMGITYASMTEDRYLEFLMQLSQRMSWPPEYRPKYDNARVVTSEKI